MYTLANRYVHTIIFELLEFFRLHWLKSYHRPRKVLQSGGQTTGISLATNMSMTPFTFTPEPPANSRAESVVMGGSGAKPLMPKAFYHLSLQRWGKIYIILRILQAVYLYSQYQQKHNNRIQLLLATTVNLQNCLLQRHSSLELDVYAEEITKEWFRRWAE